MKTVIVALVIAVSVLTQANAQGRQAGPPPPATPTPPPQQPATPPPPPPAAVNVRIDVTLIDEGGPQTLRESVSLTTTDRQEAVSRSEAEVNGNVMPTILNVDATPQVSGLPTGKIRLRMSLDYLPKWIENQPLGSRTRTRSSFAVVLDDAKSMVVANISDPATDRRVRVEVIATILK
jgi:hypothetical protein